ncbi:MAG: hypothetical protein IPL99_11520 [Candidatus Competibacteraceae bacterium]|nr:hypothetical protein [Candidatus Competibacteraceae bacterium]
MLYSTDITLSALELYRLYKARFQINFFFEMPNNFTGLLDCQARCPSALRFHFNASMTALSLLKLNRSAAIRGAERSAISIARWKIRNFNERSQTLSSTLGLDFSWIKTSPHFADLHATTGLSLHETVRTIVKVKWG